MRHGQAVDAYAAASDAQRHLTAIGRRQSAEVALGLQGQGLVPTHVYTSPLVRAVQTAEAVSHTLGLAGPIPAHPPLVPGSATAKALSILDQHGPDDRVLLVSHEPTVRVLGGFLGQLDLPPFPTSGVAIFELGEQRRFLGRLCPDRGWRPPDDLGY